MYLNPFCNPAIFNELVPLSIGIHPQKFPIDKADRLQDSIPWDVFGKHSKHRRCEPNLHTVYVRETMRV